MKNVKQKNLDYLKEAILNGISTPHLHFIMMYRSFYYERTILNLFVYEQTRSP